MVSRQQASTTPLGERNEARTPPYAFWWAQERRFKRKFAVDVAATAANALCERYITKEQDALAFSTRWGQVGELVWCNPPYDRITPWLRRAIEEARRGVESVMLIPTPNGDTRDRLIYEYATSITMVCGRMRFLRPNGEQMKTPERGSCFVHFATALPPAGDIRMDWVLRDSMLSAYHNPTTIL